MSLDRQSGLEDLAELVYELMYDWDSTAKSKIDAQQFDNEEDRAAAIAAHGKLLLQWRVTIKEGFWKVQGEIRELKGRISAMSYDLENARKWRNDHEQHEMGQ